METDERALLKKYGIWFVLLLFCAHVFYTNVIVLNKERYEFEQRKLDETRKFSKKVSAARKNLQQWLSKVEKVRAGEQDFAGHLFEKDNHWKLLNTITTEAGRRGVEIKTVTCGKFSALGQSGTYRKLPINVTGTGDYKALKEFMGWLKANQSLSCDKIDMRYDRKKNVLLANMSLSGWFK